MHGSCYISLFTFKSFDQFNPPELPQILDIYSVVVLQQVRTPAFHFNLLKNILFKNSEIWTTSRTFKSRPLAQCAIFVLSDYWPRLPAQNWNTLSPEEALTRSPGDMFCVLMFFNATRKLLPSFAFSCCSVTNGSVCEGDWWHQEIPDLPHLAWRPMVLLGASCCLPPRQALLSPPHYLGWEFRTKNFLQHFHVILMRLIQ